MHASLADLPAYMRPSAFVFLDVLPLTPIGKVDRSRLPVPERSRLNVTADYQAPGSRLEAQLAAIWSKVLGMDDLGVHDNFIELGGESLHSIRIVALVIEPLGVEISFRQFFNTQTIAEMAELIERSPAGSNGRPPTLACRTYAGRFSITS